MKKEYLQENAKIFCFKGEDFFEALKKDSSVFQVGTIISQEQGEDVSYHGTPMYDTITKFKIGEKIFTHSEDEKTALRPISFVSATQIDAVCDFQLKQVNEEIELLKREIQEKEEQKHIILNHKSELHQLLIVNTIEEKQLSAFKTDAPYLEIVSTNDDFLFDIIQKQGNKFSLEKGKDIIFEANSRKFMVGEESKVNITIHYTLNEKDILIWNNSETELGWDGIDLENDFKDLDEKIKNLTQEKDTDISENFELEMEL